MCNIFVMRLMIWVACLSITLPCQAAQAASLKQQVSDLDVLPIAYGANTIKVGQNDILITRGNFNMEMAWGGDAYIIMVHDKKSDKTFDWKVVRYEKDHENKAMIITTPHTYEDSIMSVRFMVPKAKLPDASLEDLYLLKALRDYRPNPSGLPDGYEDETVATFTLYRLERNSDFGIFYWRQVAEQTTKKRYCNVDWAMKQELDVALPNNDVDEYKCEEHH